MNYLEAKDGILAQLAKDGFGEPHAKYTIEIANGNKAKAADIAQKFSGHHRTVGQMAGAKASKVLKGARPSTVPIETLKQLDVVLNMKTARAGHIDVPSPFLKAAARVIE